MGLEKMVEICILKGENRIMSDLLFQNLYRIPSARAWWHNYGHYFITICTAGRECYFGEIRRGIDGINRIIYSEMGVEAIRQIELAVEHHPYCKIPYWAVMPNHVHMIVAIDETKTPHFKRCDGGRYVLQNVSTDDNIPIRRATEMQSWLSVVIRQYKSWVTHYANETGCSFGWQTRFHDHIIRDQLEFDRIAYYVANNVALWDSDCFRR